MNILAVRDFSTMTHQTGMTHSYHDQFNQTAELNQKSNQLQFEIVNSIAWMKYDHVGDAVNVVS